MIEVHKKTEGSKMRECFKLLVSAVCLLSMVGCAVMHHTQLGEVDSDVVLKGRKFEILVSQTGVSTEEIGAVGRAAGGNAGDAVAGAAVIISLFQFGPRTGNQVYSDVYADKVFDLLQKECPSGRVSGLMSVRETAKYPVVSGEVVKITGYCQNS